MEYDHAFASRLPIATSALAILIGYGVLTVLYRLFLHPLAKVPGPRLAAATSLYEFYYDCVLGGKYTFKVDELHRQYGPCVRINPWEIHISDSAYWDILYNNSNRLDKDKWFYGAFGSHEGTVATPSHDLHRFRRAVMAPYFSTANVRKLEPVVLERIQKLCDRLEVHGESGEPVNLSNAFRCLSTDVVTHFAFPKPRSMLDTPDFSKDFTRLLRDFSALMTWQRHLRIVFPILFSIPDWITLRLDPTDGSRQMMEYQKSFLEQSQMAVDREGKPEDGSEPSLLDAIAAANFKGVKERRVERIAEEANLTVGAGTETTGATLSALMFYVLSNPVILARLKAELTEAASTSTTPNDSNNLLIYKTLERLPYLSATLTESLRIASPVSGRLPRINPRASMTYTDTATHKTYGFPTGTVLSMSMRDLHSDASIFPNPAEFRPERWLDASPEDLVRMQGAFVPFSRGSRNCVGQELAREELTLTAGNLLKSFDFELYGTTERDVRIAHDWFAPFAELDSEGLRARVL